MYDGSDDYEEGIGQVPQEPHLHWLDGGGAGERGGDREVDRGQDHHAGDVNWNRSIISLAIIANTVYLVPVINSSGWFSVFR